MPRDTLDRKLAKLQDDILILGSMVEEAIQAAVTALDAHDLEKAARIIEGDLKINAKRFQIEQDCLILIATQSPMAGDVRVTAAILEIATDLERMGDYGKGLSKINLMLGKTPRLEPPTDLPVMADMACDMLRRALDAFVERDVDAAEAIPDEDDELDALYNKVYRELLDDIIEDPTVTDEATHLLWAAHNLERAGDRVTNICERVLFTVTGQMTELDIDDEDLPQF
jgi:phosphate transport system protein